MIFAAVLGLLGGLVVEELGPAVEALPGEVERDAHVGLVGGELARDLCDEELGGLFGDHRGSLVMRRYPKHRPAARRVTRRQPRRSPREADPDLT